MKRGKPIKRRTGIKSVSTNPDRRRRQRQKKARWYGRDENGDFAAFVRSRGCYIRKLHDCVGPVEAASLDKTNRRQPNASGIGRLIGLCSQGHVEQEGNTRRFERKYGVSLEAGALWLAEEWG